MSDYFPVPLAEKIDEDVLAGRDSGSLHESRGSRPWQFRWSWVIHSLVYVGFAIFASIHYGGRGRNSLCLQGNENIYRNAPIEYESKIFQRAGFHGPLTPNKTVFEGRPDEQNDARWNEVLSVGIVSISEEELRRLPGGTAVSPKQPNAYVVELEMFHQLHCLKQLRKQLWEFEDGIVSGDPLQRQSHFDHCIDYLRQVVMCHGDLTPVTFEYNTDLSGYLAHHGTVHQCRNFQKIFQWAKIRDNTGMGPDGEHRNKDGASKHDFADGLRETNA